MLPHPAPRIDDAHQPKYSAPMNKGFNSDLSVRGKKYHVQSEDWGSQNPYLVSRIFCNGAVLKTVKTPHETALREGPVNQHEAIAQALQRQHQQIMSDLLAGTLV